MLWARPIWGIWWTWDARLTTFLLLWLLYVSYLITRQVLLDRTGPHAGGGDLGVRRDRRADHVYVDQLVADAASFAGAARGRTAGCQLLSGSVVESGGMGDVGAVPAGLRYGLERRRQRAEQEAALEAIEASLELTK